MRVVIVGNPSQLNSSYRVMQPAQALEQHGHSVLVWLAEEGELDPRSLDGFDAVYVYRYTSRRTQRILEQVRESGTAIVWDNDDDLTVATSHAVASRKRGALRSQQIASLLHATLSLADVTTTTSAHLQRLFLANGATDVRVIENFVAAEFASATPTRQNDDDHVVVGWTAAKEHSHELERLGLRPVLRRLLDTHPNVRVETVGIVLDLDRDRSHAHGYVPFAELPALVARFDVGIAPLVDDEFNRARSDVKLKEYASLGIPWLASPIGPYTGLGEREGGRLVENERWYEELERMVTHPRRRRKLAKRARRWASSQSVERHASQWVEAFEAAVRRRREPTAAR